MGVVPNRRSEARKRFCLLAAASGATVGHAREVVASNEIFKKGEGGIAKNKTISSRDYGHKAPIYDL